MIQHLLDQFLMLHALFLFEQFDQKSVNRHFSFLKNFFLGFFNLLFTFTLLICIDFHKAVFVLEITFHFECVLWEELLSLK